MLKILRQSLIALVALTVITGIIYPLAVTGIAAGVFPHKSSGGLIVQNGKALGSALIGQSFSDPKYFWSRPSATSPEPYNGVASSGSNLGPTNPALLQAVEERIAALRAADPGNTLPVPVDLVTASGSGLDPDISPAAAYYQAARVARARGLTLAEVEGLIARFTKGRQLGILGDPRVNVVQLNLALDSLATSGANPPGN
jgi:K+-transporting ATPase ATPase C chain